MSLAVAVWESPTRYTLAADSRITVAVGDGQIDHTTKVWRLGRWLCAWAGAVPAASHLRRRLREPETDDHEAVEAALTAAWDATLPHCGPSDPSEYPRTGGYLLLVGPTGVVDMDSYGTCMWAAPASDAPTCFRAIGVVDYATGWLDRERVTVEDAERAVLAACRRYPTVGGPVDVLCSEGPWPSPFREIAVAPMSVHHEAPKA